MLSRSWVYARKIFVTLGAAALVAMAASVAVASASPGVRGISGSKAPKPYPLSGTDFWTAFESNCTFDGCGAPGPGALSLLINSATATSGTVSVGKFSDDFTVTPGTTTTVSVPSSYEDDKSAKTQPDGVHVVSQAPVTVDGYNALSESSYGFNGIPTPLLGTDYVVDAWGSGYGSQFAVLATKNDTAVTFTPSETAGSYKQGHTYTATLDQGQVFQLVDATGLNEGGDLSGTLVRANKPVAVYGGNDCGYVESNQSCDPFGTEMTPVTGWGETFYADPFSEGAVLRVLADTAHTSVSVNGSNVATLNAGQIYQADLTSPSSITASSPVEVFEYTTSNASDGDDSFSIVAPSTQWAKSYLVPSNPGGLDSNISSNYLSVVVPSKGTSKVKLNGEKLPASDFTAIPSTSYSAGEIAASAGTNAISDNAPIGVLAYGYGSYDGYSYNAGFELP